MTSARVLLLAVVLGTAASAQTARQPLAGILHDADGDRVPDRLGETVAFAGRSSVDAGVFGRADQLYVQDATGGVELRGGMGANSFDGRVQAGDSLLVTGILAFRNGMATVEPKSVRRVAGARRVPDVVRYDPAQADAMEGRLVEAEGVVVGQSQVSVGHALIVSLDDLSLVVVFAYDDQPAPVSFADIEPGDRVRVRGVAGQYDRAAPYTDSYQIYPRLQADLQTTGIPTSAYRWVAIGALALFLIALGLSVALRAQVRCRVEALRASEDRYHTLLDRASDAIFIHDLDSGNAEGNRAARALFELPDGAPLPPLLDAVAPQDQDRARDHLRQLRAHGNARTDLCLAPPDAPARLFEIESQVIDVGGVDRVLSLGRDVGSRRAYERGLIAAREEAEEMARVKSAFLASMSHEIRTPLTAVIGFAELLMDEVDADTRGLVEAIEAGGQRLLGTLNSVLDLATLDAQRETLRPVPLDVVGHVERGVGLLRPLADERGLRLDVEASAATLPATLDAGALDRVLTNLVGNAVKFTEEGGVTVEVDGDPDTVVLRVIDTGIGIADDFLPDLFAEFRQQSEGDARSHEGTGLGLAITQRLVELMGGTIAVDSQWGVGTAFTVTLPRLAAGDGAAQEAEMAEVRA